MSSLDARGPLRHRVRPGRAAALLAALLGVGCLSAPSDAQEPTSELVPTTLVENGQVIRLELVFYRPAGPGPFPTIVFHHGSTGTGSDPARFGVTRSSRRFSAVANALGWMVVFPQRRGRGRSDGLYDEGFAPDRSGYSCDPAYALPGVDRALEDLDAVLEHLQGRPEVQAARLVVAGESRGGILAIAHPGRRPAAFLGAINFVGGWMSDRCPDPTAINTVTFVRGAASPRPTLWLYGEGDPYYSVAHSRSNFDAFRAAGGHGVLHVFRLPPGTSGHEVIGQQALWQDLVTAFLRGLPGG